MHQTHPCHFASHRSPLTSAARTRNRCHAFTIIEVLISLIVVSLLSLSIAAMMHAVGYGTDARREVRRVAVRTQQARLRLDDAVRTAQQVLAVGNGYIVLWMGDTNTTDDNKEKVNLSELQLIEVAAGSTVLTSYVATNPGSDPVYASNYAQAAQTAKNNGSLVASPWADHVSSFTVVCDVAPPDTQLVTWRFTLTDRSLIEPLVGSVSLRPHGAADGEGG